MPATLLDVDLLGGPFLSGCFVFGAVMLIALLLSAWGTKVPWRRWVVRLIILAAAGLALGLILTWLISDVWDAVGVSLSVPTRLWVSVTLAGVAMAAGNLWGTRWWTKLVAIVAMPVFFVVGCVGINADIGEYKTLDQLLVGSKISPLKIPTPTPHGTYTEPLSRSWSAPQGMPARGRVGTVNIPGTVSHFTTRAAIVYLPPAALVASPPELPVLIVLSGQPGQPADIVEKAGLVVTLDAFAHSHDGLAPIVVIPDQLGNQNANPMCVDSALGNSDTYLTVDVPAWITHLLRVKTDRASWAIAGFSQGGTCAIQLGSKHPDLFGSLVDVSGELAPKHGSLATTIDLGFGGNAAAYEAAKPLAIMATNAPYRDTMAIFAVGQDDTRFGPNQRVVSKAAMKAGMRVTSFEVPHTAHDWHCATSALSRGLHLVAGRFGLESG